MANFGIFDNQNIDLNGQSGRLLLANGVDAILIFPPQATRDQRRFPDDGFRNFPTPIDLQRDWPDV
jgi:hypothetical protein